MFDRSASPLAVGIQPIDAFVPSTLALSQLGLNSLELPLLTPQMLAARAYHDDVLQIPGSSRDSVTVRGVWTERDALYDNEVGVYRIAVDGSVDGVAPTDAGYAEAVLRSISRQVLFRSGEGAGAEQTIVLQGNELLAFYLIQNNSAENLFTRNPENQLCGSPLMFFSVNAANPDRYDHVFVRSASDEAGSPRLLEVRWEDLTRGGDEDFNDAVFTLKVVQVQSPELPKLSIADVVVNEGDSGFSQATFTVQLSEAATAPVSVDYSTANDTALAGVDYTETKGSLAFAPGETSKTFTVPILGDTLVEGDEVFGVQLSNPANSILEDAIAVGSIVNDDRLPLPSISVSSPVVVEGDAGSRLATFSLTLSSVSALPVSVAYTTKDASALAGEDYAATQGSLTFLPGETTKTIQVAVSGDFLIEPDETFSLVLSDPLNATLPIATFTGTIKDNDAAAFKEALAENEVLSQSVEKTLQSLTTYLVDAKTDLQAAKTELQDILKQAEPSPTPVPTPVTLTTAAAGIWSLPITGQVPYQEVTNSGTSSFLQWGATGFFFGQPLGRLTNYLRYRQATATATIGSPFKVGRLDYFNERLHPSTVLNGDVPLTLSIKLDDSTTKTFEYVFTVLDAPALVGLTGSDRVQLAAGQSPLRPFEYQGKRYTFEFMGFSPDNGQNFYSSLNSFNGSLLFEDVYARIVPENAAVQAKENTPLPATFLLKNINEKITLGLDQTSRSVEALEAEKKRLEVALSDLDTALANAGDPSLEDNPIVLFDILDELEYAENFVKEQLDSLNTAYSNLRRDDANLKAAIAEFTQYTTPIPSANNKFDVPLAQQPLIGFIDTGFTLDSLELTRSRITLGRDRIDNDADPLLASGTGNPHGTHLLGIVGATKGNQYGIEGINDDAPVWVGRAVGSGKWAESLVEFVDAAKASGQPHAIANLGFDLVTQKADGSVVTRTELTAEEIAALTYARDNGVLVVVAAGNQGSGMSALGQAAQWFDNIVTVGAADGAGRAAYSSFGQGLTLLATGGTAAKPVVSLTGDGLGTMQGTSVAAAEVTGAISQVWAANPTLSYQQIVQILKETATDLATPGVDAETGAGLLNLEAAVNRAKTTTAQAITSASLPLAILPVFNQANAVGETPLERPAFWQLLLRSLPVIIGIIRLLSLIDDATRFQSILDLRIDARRLENEADLLEEEIKKGNLNELDKARKQRDADQLRKDAQDLKDQAEKEELDALRDKLVDSARSKLKSLEKTKKYFKSKADELLEKNLEDLNPDLNPDTPTIVRRKGMAENPVLDGNGRPILTPDGLEVKVYGQPFEGSSRTEGHGEAMVRRVQELAATGNYEYFTYQRSVKTATGRLDASRNIPDVIGVRRDGKVDMWEVPSISDTEVALRRRLDETMESLPPQMQGIPDLITITPEDAEKSRIRKSMNKP